MSYYDFTRFQDRISDYEFRQAHAAQLPVEITSYAEALAWWKRRNGEEFRGTNERPVAKREWNNRRMRMRSDGSIEFEDNSHVLCVWHPDDTLSVEPFKTARYGAFERFVLPRTIEGDIGARTGSVIFLKPNNAASHTKITVETDTGTHRMSNPEVLVVRAKDGPVQLQRVGRTQCWEPVNEYHLKPFYWQELNRSELREASKRYNFPEFIAAIQAAIMMGADIPTLTPHTSSAVDTRQAPTGEDILTLLEQNRFVEAAALVRGTENRHYDAVTKQTVTEKLGLNNTDIKKIRHMAYKEMGLLYIETARIVSLPQFNNIEVKLRDFGDPDL